MVTNKAAETKWDEPENQTSHHESVVDTWWQALG